MRVELNCQTCRSTRREEVPGWGSWTVQHACRGPGAPWWRLLPEGAATAVTTSAAIRG